MNTDKEEAYPSNDIGAKIYKKEFLFHKWYRNEMWISNEDPGDKSSC